MYLTVSGLDGLDENLLGGCGFHLRFVIDHGFCKECNVNHRSDVNGVKKCVMGKPTSQVEGGQVRHWGGDSVNEANVGKNTQAIALMPCCVDVGWLRAYLALAKCQSKLPIRKIRYIVQLRDTSGSTDFFNGRSELIHDISIHFKNIKLISQFTTVFNLKYKNLWKKNTVWKII